MKTLDIFTNTFSVHFGAPNKFYSFIQNVFENLKCVFSTQNSIQMPVLNYLLYNNRNHIIITSSCVVIIHDRYLKQILNTLITYYKKYINSVGHYQKS